MNPDRRKRLLFLVAALCVGALAADRFILTPQLAAWGERSQRVAVLRGDLAKAEALLERKEAWEERWREAQAMGLPKDPTAAVSQALKSVDQWGKEAGLTISSLKPRLAESKEGWSLVEFRATGQGPLGAIVRFVYLMESAETALRVEEAQIAARGKSANDLTLELRFTGLMTPQSAAKEADGSRKE